MKFTDEQLRTIATRIHKGPGRAVHADGREWDEERGSLADELLILRRRLRGMNASIDDALNSGDGTYKP